MTAREISIIWTKAGVPSCIRVPPLAVVASTGMPSAVARRIALVIRRAAARPIEPARKRNSFASTATGRPCTRPRPVRTDSSVPAFARAASSSAR